MFSVRSRQPRLKLLPPFLVRHLSKIGFAIWAGGFLWLNLCQGAHADSPQRTKLYWFIPDGLRVDRGTFNIFAWVQQGEMPNLKIMMNRGCYGYSWPEFPGHTPTNYASLATGVSPDVHGIADGPMRIEGFPLSQVSKGGFSSFSKLVPPIWVQLEKKNQIVTLESVPGSTPPDIQNGNIIRGRWGAWGIDFPAVIFTQRPQANKPGPGGKGKRLFGFGPELTTYRVSTPAHGWLTPSPSPETSKPLFEVDLTNWKAPLFALVSQTIDGSPSSPLTVSFSSDKRQILTVLRVGEWSPWLPVELTYSIAHKEQATEVRVPTAMKIHVIHLSPTEFRFRVLYDGLNEFTTQPRQLAKRLQERIGPMVDFVDNFPPQLIYHAGDKKAFLDEAQESWDWHQKAVPVLMKELKSDVVLHSVYTPNQMLTSRWWLPFLDPQSPRYQEKPAAEKAQLWSEVKSMYRRVDDMLGEILKAVGDQGYVVLSSDHGVVPLFKEVRLNNLFAQKGWLKYNYNKDTQDYEIDWAKTRVIYLQMNQIYINPIGLSGPYNRAKGSKYQKLREQVKQALLTLVDPETGEKPLHQVWTHEDSTSIPLPSDRVGDLIIANRAPYAWSEDLSPDSRVFESSLKGGYKQGIWPESSEAMLTPFVIVGPKIKSRCQLKTPIQHVDQFATLAEILGLKPPYKVKGRVLSEIFKE